MPKIFSGVVESEIIQSSKAGEGVAIAYELSEVLRKIKKDIYCSLFALPNINKSDKGDRGSRSPSGKCCKCLTKIK